MKNPPSISESDHRHFGEATRYISVRARESTGRDWLADGPSCPLLEQHHVAHVGIMWAQPPFQVVRVDQSGTFMLVCFGGEGVVMVDGAWKLIKKGQACLLPPFVKNSLKCVPGSSWDFVWVRYEESRETTPILSSLSPVTGSFDPAPFKAVVEGLHAETSGNQRLSALHHWTELLHQYVLDFAQPHQPDNRLWRLWQKVDADLSKSWSLADLAAIAFVSEEHLRRLCRKQLGRSPMQHLTFLRLQRARHLLSTTDDKVEVIARAVGFESPFSFSNTFKKWIGWRPSEYRATSRNLIAYIKGDR